VLQQVLAESPAGLSADLQNTAAPAELTESAADIAHSEENILKWMQYLPPDCVNTMIIMGWDIST
jgi:hypothetical protein